jgi:phosphopantothenoylcysteine decarboxylase/phosphopantothenate--cysteine ligase
MSESGSDSAELRARGQAKLARKGLDYIVVNQVFRDQRGFAVDNNRVMILSKRGTAADLAEMPKTELAFRLLAWIHEDHQAAQRLSQPGLQLS